MQMAGGSNVIQGGKGGDKKHKSFQRFEKEVEGLRGASSW